MENELKLIKEIEEKKYYPLLCKEIDKQSRSIKTKEEKNRVNEELNLIHVGSNSKLIYLCYLLCKETKNRNQPFEIHGTAANLYVLWLLNVVKINPYKINSNYEFALGADKENLKDLEINICVPISFRETLIRILEHLDNKSNIYRETYSKEKGEYNKDKFLLIPKELQVNKYFDVIEEKEEYYSLIYSNKNGSFPLKISISSNFELELLIRLRKTFGPLTDETVGIEQIYYLIENGLIEGIGYGYKNSYFTVENSKEKNLHQLISLFGISLATYYDSSVCCNRNILKKEYIEFSDRDSMFNYFKKNFKEDKKDQFAIIEEIRKGKFRNYITEFTGIGTLGEILSNILYLFPKGHISEMVFYSLQLAQYKVSHPLTFMKIYETIKEKDKWNNF